MQFLDLFMLNKLVINSLKPDGSKFQYLWDMISRLKNGGIT